MTTINNRFWFGVPGFFIGASGQCLSHPNGLHIFTKISFNRFHIFLIQHYTGQKDGKLSSSAMSPMGLPPRVTLLAKAIQIDSVLSELYKKRLLLCLGKIQSEEKTR